jgi:mono/diheme cytochrome c family protein
MRCGSARAITGMLAFGAIAVPWMRAADTTDSLDARFTERVRPFLTSYCIGCHSGNSPAAQFDLRQYSNLDAVVRDYPRWNLVLEKLSAREMPPKPMPQPPDAARQMVIEWVRSVRANEARRSAGDPGPVLARRLSNAEYNYTIRDLTGVDLRPTREFPVDPANSAGFDNSGESLSMSPALLAKYLQAARETANHMVLNLDGIAFAPNPMLVETDREKYTIQRIVDFYDRQPTDYADYFRAAWMYKHRAAFGKPHATLGDIAAETKVSPKYLATVWQALEQTKEDVGPLAKLQAMWRELPAPEGRQADFVREPCAQMRDFVVRIHRLTAPMFRSPAVTGLSPSSQPLMNWKLKQFATHRRDFDRAALRVEGEPPPSESALALDHGAVGGSKDQEEVRRWVETILQGRREDPDLAAPAGQRPRYEAAFARFSAIFPDAFYIRERGRFYPVDTLDKGRLLSAGFHNVMGYYRDDLPLMELILDEKGRQELDRLWQEFDFIADVTTRTYVQFYFNQSGEVRGMGRESGTARPADKDVIAEPVIMGLRQLYLAKAEAAGNPVAVQAVMEHFERVNSTIRWVERARLEAEPRHLDALLRFAARAYRRPLSPAEREGILGYYRQLREKDGLTHEEAMRDSITSVLMSPYFCYRIDQTDAGPASPSHATRAVKGAPAGVRPLAEYSLASRLSYFLWSSMPDDELTAHAAAGDLHTPAVLLAEARRMLKDERALGLATEFGGNWLDFRHFEDYNSVDRERFPSFDNDLREAMFQEPVRFLSDVIRNDRSVLDIIYGNHTFVNPVLARHYGMPPVAAKPDEWVRVDNAREYGRGGVLPMAVFLTENAPGLRTSPVKRGNWVVKRVLGEVIPPPPANVPELPSDEAKMDLPLPEMLARHRQNPVCASCHARFDSFGLVFEGYGPIGDRRAKDLAGRPVAADAVFPDHSEASGLDGLQAYIRAHREKDFEDNLCRKLLAYALGRSLGLSDELLAGQMRARLEEQQFRFSALVEAIVTSPQFLTKRISGPPPEKGSP